METKDTPRPSIAPPRSRRSHTNLSNLRLAPLSTDFAFQPLSTSPSTSPNTLAVPLAYQTHHTSYISGRSAPSTPGILARTSSRSRQHGALSRKLSLYSTLDDDDYDYEYGGPVKAAYAGVPVNKDGVALSALRGEAGMGAIPKAKSDAALLVHQRRIPHTYHASSHHQRSHTGVTIASTRRESKKDSDSDWLTRAGLTTSSLLRESKGHSSWLTHSSHPSYYPALSVHETTAPTPLPFSSSPSSPLLPYDTHLPLRSPTTAAHSRNASTLRLHFADDEFSPETPRGHYDGPAGYQSTWGSRFGSRAPSARTSRRGSRSELLRTPGAMAAGEDYFASFAATSTSGVRRGQQLRGTSQGGTVPGPDFVDLGGEEEGEEEEDEGNDEDAEEEVARLARERGFGLGALVDRLVGWSLFNVDETQDPGSEAEGSEGEGARDGEGRRGEVSVVGEAEAILRARRAQRRGVHVAGGEETDHTRRGSAGEESGWRDAAWLLSVASRVIL